MIGGKYFHIEGKFCRRISMRQDLVLLLGVCSTLLCRLAFVDKTMHQKFIFLVGFRTSYLTVGQWWPYCT